MRRPDVLTIVLKLMELRMYSLSWAIRSKPEWQQNILDQSIMEKWRKEALDQQEGLRVEQKLTKNMVRTIRRLFLTFLMQSR
jgi:hypothetical protein